MLYIESESLDPRFNLAMEQYVFDEMDRSEEYFILWRNHNTIVVGKHQNTDAEINSEFVKRAGVSVVRRLSGGGAVYHDTGNLNFTFIMDAVDTEKLDLAMFCGPVVRALAEIGVQAEITGRNDIVIGGRKFSGNSQYISNGRILHHGTIMFDSDLEIVGQALGAQKEKLVPKGIPSVRSRVTNVSSHLDRPVSLEDFKKILIEQTAKSMVLKPYSLSDEDIRKIKEIKKGRYDLWEWNYGPQPEGGVVKSRRIEGCGEVTVSFNVGNGRIRDIRLGGDFFGIGDPQDISDKLSGCSTDREALTAELAGVSVGRYIHNLTNDLLVSIILD